jgi:exopolysaccharide biosynthesis WecB/TagA/CpsF family protein
MQHADLSEFFHDADRVPAPWLAFAPRPRVPRASVFDLDIVNATTEEAIDELLSPGRRRVHFVNAHCVNVMARDAAYGQALASADMLLPDGAGLEIAFSMTGQTLIENLNGTDFTPRLLQRAAAQGLSVFFFGGRPGVAEDAARTMQRRVPGLAVAGCRDGFDGAADAEAAIAAINASGADILLVAMGVPRQDTWLARYADRLAPRLCLGVGALLDFLAGRVARAPRLVRRARLEWGWRLAMEPRRMAGRYLIGNVTFLARAAAHAISRAEPRDIGRRVLDVAVAGGAALALAPLFMCLAAAVRLDSKGPVFFRQTRIGRDGRPFQVLKFRSMHTGAEAARQALLATSDRDGICFKARHDPRVTRVGRMLRRLSLDELPQIFNVLRGEMSIVGPRPALPEEVAAYPARALGRLRVKPGITGLWQVSGRAEIGFDKMVDLDLAYARSRSVLLDLFLILMTFRAVATGRGAY